MVEPKVIIVLGVTPSLELCLEKERIIHGSIDHIELLYLVIRVLEAGYLHQRPISWVLLVILQIDPTQRIV